MFKYEYEKRPASVAHSDSRVALSREWYARRPLPPRPQDVRIPSKTTVPLKVWIIAGASCFAVCAVLVLATVVITKWGTTETYPSRPIYAEIPEPLYANYPLSRPMHTKDSRTETDDIKMPVLEKLPIFKNIISNRDKKKTDNLTSKPQPHPLHDTSLEHLEKKIEKKDKAKLPDHEVPKFKPTLPDFIPHDYLSGLKPVDDNYEEYYNDDNLYDDYMQSNSMTNYLIEKVQELHDWITTDPDFQAKNKHKKSSDDFRQVLKALNESLLEGNVSIIMDTLKDIYFGENFTNTNNMRKVILTNNTSLLSFGILTLDVMLLHNIQLMAWESQESARIKMLKDPDVFAFNALFMEPSKVEAKRNEINHLFDGLAKRQNLRLDGAEEDKNFLENILEIGMSTARAAIHLGRAYKNTRLVLNQIANREQNTNLQSQISRNIDANTHALNHLQTSYNKNESLPNAANTANGIYTDLDCVWLLYCRNLKATAKLNAPYGIMARINGMALRMLTGELPADRALDTMLYEVLTGWQELRCSEMFPRCSKADAASVVLDSILQPLKKSQTANRL